jgi:tetratricopeptide (TPR) repeat protein
MKAVELDPGMAHAHYYLALIYLRRKEDARAIAAMERTVETDPAYTEAYYSLGTLYARTGRVHDGQRMIELFQQLSSSDMEEDHYRRLLYRKNEPLSADKQAASHFNLGLVYLQRGELDRAQRQFQAAIGADPIYAEAIHNIGVVLSLKGRHEEAKVRFLRAVELNPNYALAHKNLGNSYLVHGEYEVAEQSFRRALEVDADLIEAVEGLSTALIQQGRIDEGRAMRATAIARAVQ